MLEILLECKNTGTTFLVGGREIEGVFKVGLYFDVLFYMHLNSLSDHILHYLFLRSLKI
jgi:hypothetical protein